MLLKPFFVVAFSIELISLGEKQGMFVNNVIFDTIE